MAGKGQQLYRKCHHCGKPFRYWPGRAKRRASAFCTRGCWLAAWRKFKASYTRDDAPKLERAA
jgi:hypothetical protein